MIRARYLHTDYHVKKPRLGKAPKIHITASPIKTSHAI